MTIIREIAENTRWVWRQAFVGATPSERFVGRMLALSQVALCLAGLLLLVLCARMVTR